MPIPTFPLGLAALLEPCAVAEFFAAYERSLPVFIPGGEARLRALGDVGLLRSLDSLLQSWPATIEAHLPGVRDEACAVQANAPDARTMFDAGMGLLFNEANRFSPLLQHWLDTLRTDLALGASTYARCLIYATPLGGGTASHFDHNINFVLQVHGTKVWTVAANQHVLHPLSRHTLGLPTDPELATYLTTPMPTAMPTPTQSFVLTPGSVLFVPRGVWHSTEAKSEALALNFTLTAPTWLDLFGAALRSRLATMPQWRETADGVSDPGRRMECVRRLGDLLQDLVAELPHWRASDILNATETEELA